MAKIFCLSSHCELATLVIEIFEDTTQRPNIIYAFFKLFWLYLVLCISVEIRSWLKSTSLEQQKSRRVEKIFCAAAFKNAPTDLLLNLDYWIWKCFFSKILREIKIVFVGRIFELIFHFIRMVILAKLRNDSFDFDEFSK